MQGNSISQVSSQMIPAEPPSPLSRSRQGYITLSPHRSVKGKSKLSSQISERQGGSAAREPGMMRPTNSYRYEPKSQEENSGLLLRKEKPFKVIPNFSKQDIVIRNPNRQDSTDLSKSRKSKLSITKLSRGPEGR